MEVLEELISLSVDVMMICSALLLLSQRDERSLHCGLCKCQNVQCRDLTVLWDALKRLY